MGLDCSHGAFNGSYGAFNRFRKAVATCLGGSYPPHEDKSLNDKFWYFPEDPVDDRTRQAMVLFFSHSDCDGSFAPGEALVVAKLIESVLDNLDEYESKNPSAGHILRDGGYRQVAEKFTKGCRLACRELEYLEFD